MAFSEKAGEKELTELTSLKVDKSTHGFHARHLWKLPQKRFKSRIFGVN